MPTTAQPLAGVRQLRAKATCGFLIYAVWLIFSDVNLTAATLTVQTNILGPTPVISGCNLGHFYPSGNTGDWWRYLGVNGARIFISPSQIEPVSTIAAAAGLVGVSNQTSFLVCRAAMHTNQFNPNYINWSVITNNYNNNDLYPANHILVSPALAVLRGLGNSICAQITASPSTFPITDTNDWPDMWGLWHHYYAQAFYLGRYFDVQRYQIYNEPDGSTLTLTNYLLRLQLTSDAISNALADVNSLYGKSLTPIVLAPVTAGSAVSDFLTWGELVVTNRHVNFLGQTDTNFWLLQKYDYHEYGNLPSNYGGYLATLNADLLFAMSPEAPFPATISEFNNHTAANFDSLSTTLDSPSEYPVFGAIAVNLIANQINELYCYKFNQVAYASTNYPVQKNALLYVDNTNAPYNNGGITKAGEVFRLFNKAFAAGRSRVNVLADSGAATLTTHASYNPVTQRYYLYSINTNSSPLNFNMDLSALNFPATNRVLIEEVSETNYGSGVLWTNLPAGAVINATQPANSVWLLTAPNHAQQPEQIIAATADAEVRDGANKGNNYGSATTMTARNDPANTANRRAAFMKFHLPVTNLNTIEFALLSVQAACATSNCTAQAHVYFLNTTNWSSSNITWSNAPNLKQNSAAGSNIVNDVILGVGTNASIVGQIVVTSTNASEKLIDLTDFLRGQTNTDFSILVVQDPRWDVTLPSLASGDVQPDGVQITTTEGGNGPRLRLVLSATNYPSAVNDSYSVTENTLLSVSAPGVLANDSFASGAVISTGTSHGSLTLNGDGSFLYQPATNYIGLDSFTYTATNGAGASAPATVNITVNPISYWTNVLVTTEAFIRGGTNSNTDQDEVGTGYIMVKYDTTPFTAARKAYFQFDLTGLNVNTATQAVFTINFLNNYQQNVQLWSLNQPYTNFSSVLTWNNAQANDTNSDNLLTSGAFTATAVGSLTNLPSSGTTPQSFVLLPLASFIQSNRVTLALSSAADLNSSGLRILRTNATLQVFISNAVTPTNLPPQITGITASPNGSIVLNFSGAAGSQIRLLATTNLAPANWVGISTNFFNTSGAWSFTNYDQTNFPQRFYRAVSP